MLKGIYTPLSGAVAQEKVLEIIANNLANVNTTGFKADNVSFTVLEPEPEKHYRNPLPPANYKINFQDLAPFRGNEIAYVGIADIERDLSQGPVIETGNPTDLMIGGDGYFAINTTEGIRYTRDGSFTLSQDGALVTQKGHPVLGEKGVIYLRSGQFEINHLGEVYQDGEFIDRLAIYKFKEPKSLERAGYNMFFYAGSEVDQQKVEFPQVWQGKLEGSNVNAIKSMTAMIMAHRSFEAYQKALSNFDSMMEKSSNTLGEVQA